MDNVIVNGILKEFENEFGISLAPDKSFEYLINYLVVSRIQTEAVETTEQILSIDVDELGGNFGIDGIAIFANDNIIVSPSDLELCTSKSNHVSFVFTQSKTSPKIDVGEISKLSRAVQAFFKEGQSQNYDNNMLNKYSIKEKIFEREFAKNMSRESPECILYFAYTGNYQGDKTVEEVIKQERDNIIRENPFLKSVRFIIIDSSKIVSMYNESQNAIEIDIDFKERLSLQNIDKINDVYYGFIDKDEFFKLIEDEEGNIRSNIFYENVRDYLGDENPVNSEIIGTLTSPQNCQYFPVLNNGITIITRFIKPISSTRLTIKDYQIVNGCQTSNAIHRCKGALNDIDLPIPIKIVYTVDSSVISSIVRANNKQSIVPEEAFIALGEFHKQLQEFYKQKSKEVNLPIYYERRSREIANDEELHLCKEQIITLHAQIRAVVSVFYNAPHLVYSNNPTSILKMKYPFFENDHKFEAYYMGAYIVAKIRRILKQRKIASKYTYFIYYMAMYFRVICSDSIKAYHLSDPNIEKELKKIVAILDNDEESMRVIKKITSLIDSAIINVRNMDRKYSNMSLGQVAALTAFEEEIKKVYLKC